MLGRRLFFVVLVGCYSAMIVMAAVAITRQRDGRFVIVPMSPPADEQIGRLQGDRQQRNEELITAAHKVPMLLASNDQTGIYPALTGFQVQTNGVRAHAMN